MLDQILTDARSKMSKSFEITREDVATVRTGRATSALIENMIITAYEGTQKLKLKELATITTQDSKTLLVAPFDINITPEIQKSIQDAKTGLTPSQDGEVIRVTIPPLSEERRREYIKLMKTKLEGGRIMIRQIRQESMKEVKKMKEDNTLTEDERHTAEKKIQEITDEFIKSLDKLGSKKEQELMQV